MTRQLTALLIGTALFAGCTPEPPPARTTTEFLDNPLLLEAAMVRCSADRKATRYDQECINARTAVRRIQAKEEEARRVELEERSERKRQALRRTQQAAAEARRRAEEAERKRQEAEYLAQFGVLPPPESGEETAETLPEGNLPIAVVPEAVVDEPSGRIEGAAAPASDGGNAPTATSEPETIVPEAATPEEEARDLESIREELRRRTDEDGN